MTTTETQARNTNSPATDAGLPGSQSPGENVSLYHRTKHDAAMAIMRDGFRGGSGYYLSEFYFEDVVWLSDDWRGEQEVGGGSLIQVDVPPDADLDYWEVVEEGAPREWAIPASIVNAWPRRRSNGP